MLSLIRSPLPSILHERASLPTGVAELLQRAQQRPHRFVWIVPTSRRRRGLVQEWLGEKTAAILPKLHTLESFVLRALEHGVRQQRQIAGPERILRLARAWQEITERVAPTARRQWHLGAGFIHQLDRFVRDWQACGLPLPPAPKDDFERLIVRYSEDLARDSCLDRMGSVAALIDELSDAKNGAAPWFLQRVEAIVFDGFHRLERVELELIAALAEHCEVVLWLVGVQGQGSWQTVESATRFLQERGKGVSVVDHTSKTVSAIGALGRELFQARAKPQAGGGESPPGLFKLETTSALAEVEAVAKQIKADFLESQAGSRPLRLSDIAVVIPGPGYDPLIREAFPRAGLEFNLAGRALLVSTSRPARVLMAAIKVIRGQWRYDLLLDFLNHPLVKLRLKEAHRLYDLFDHRPRARRRLDYQAWKDSWNQLMRRWKSNIEGWSTSRSELPEHVLSREEYVQKQTELVESLERLIASIHTILQPVAAIERLIAESGQPGRPGGESTAPMQAPMRELIGPFVELFRLLEIGKWLTPPAAETRRQGDRETGRQEPEGSPVLWVEYEKDQQAYFKLLGILETLKDLPAERLPVGDRPDPLRALELALDGETYQIKTEDDAGVQVFEIREIRGLRFRHVYMLGLVNGQVPALPEEGTLVTRRRYVRLLEKQLEEKEGEAEFLFSQLFEAAQEKLVLSHPIMEGDQKTLPSPFLTAVEGLSALRPVDSPKLVVSVREAASGLGRAAANVQVCGKNLPELWSGLTAEQGKYLEPVLAALEDWQRKPRLGDLAVDWPELWQILFPDDYLFSASQLETYAACPFRFFGKQVLRLEERETDSTRLHYGLLVHRVLQRYYTERRQGLAMTDRQPLTAVGQQDKARLVHLFREEWDRLDEGPVPPDLEKLFCCSGGVLDLFFEVMDAIEGEPENFGNLATELELPRVLLGADKQGRPVFLTGKIDRVDGRRNDPALAIIIDYKTGRIGSRASLKTKVADGRMLQLPLYAAAVQMQHSDLKIIGGAYLHLSERKSQQETSPQNAIAAVGQLLAKGTEAGEDSFDLESARQLAIELAEGIRAGRFPLTRFPKGGEDTECTRFCLLRHACRHPAGYETPYG